MMTTPSATAPETTRDDELAAQIESHLPHYYDRRDRQVWWTRRQLWLKGNYPQAIYDTGDGEELLEKTRAYYNPDHANNP